MKCSQQMEMQKLQQGALNTIPSASAGSKSPYDKIVTENDRLARDYKREMARTEKLQLTLSTLQIQHDKLSQEVDRLNKSVSVSIPVKLAPSTSGSRVGRQDKLRGDQLRGESEVKVEQLQAEVEKKTTMLMEVKRHLKEAAEREKELKNLSSDTQVHYFNECIPCIYSVN